MNEGSVPYGGVLLLDKPAGLSSFQALRPVKKAFPRTKIGHAGTLDPAATGLLVVGVGGGTRLLEYMEAMPKTYCFVARFGLDSDSYDMESPIRLAEGEMARVAAELTRQAVEKALDAFRGPIRQTPPDYSAIKIDGERACDRVRAGETVTLAAREVVVHSLELLDFTPAQGNTSNTGAIATLLMTCSKGTYVRSLVHDLGLSLDCNAVADKIRRLAIGPFKVEAALAPDSLRATEPGDGGNTGMLLPLDVAVSHLPLARLSQAGVSDFLLGRAIHPDAYTASDWVAGSEPSPEYRAVNAAGTLIAIATLNPQGMLCPKKVLARN
jgi:tRNA pseudouridine55 synthase